MKNNGNIQLASASGILHCLELLAQEAGTLRLPDTKLAIEDALQAARTEYQDASTGNARPEFQMCLH